MSANHSFLSDRTYGYDMVVATTQAAVNNTMIEWLEGIKSHPFAQAYVKKGDAAPVPFSFEQLKQDLGADPFDIPAGTPVSSEHIAKLQAMGFSCAFIADPGFPEDLSAPYPPVIEFKKEGTEVSFNLICRTFRLIALDQAPGKAAQWINLTQDDSPRPWIFTYTVPLDTRKVKTSVFFHQLPEPTQLLIGHEHNDMFSVQKLYLNFAAGVLGSKIEIPDVPQSIHASFYKFLAAFVAQLGSHKEAVLGHSLLNDQPDASTSLVPTDVRHFISAHKDTNGKPSTEYRAYTLNYLIMTRGRVMPSATGFSWNWVEKDKTAVYAGVMAINRTIFAGYLANALREPVRHITVYPEVSLSCDLSSVTVRWNFHPEPKERYFNMPQTGPLILNYHYYRQDISHSNATFYTGTLEIRYSAALEATLTGTTIQIKTTVTVFFYLRVGEGKAQGTIVKRVIDIPYTIGVDAMGKIAVKKGTPDIKELPADLSIDTWMKIISLNQINSHVAGITRRINTQVEQFLANEVQSIDAVLNGPHSWIFPGGKTFSFTNAQFSDHQDLTANILYAAPNLKHYNAGQ